MTALASTSDRPYAILVDNAVMIGNLVQALSEGDHTANTIPGLMARVIRDKSWQHWVDPRTGFEQKYRPHEFRQFLESPRPHGLQTKVDDAARWFTDGTKEWVAFHEALRGKPGNPTGANQYSGVQPRNDLGQSSNNYEVNITDDSANIVPFTPSRPLGGNSTNYGIRRLGRERPDLLEKVSTGELTVHRAMIDGGFKDETITIPIDPQKAALRLAMLFRGDDLASLIATLSNYIDSPPEPPRRGRPRKEVAR